MNYSIEAQIGDYPKGIYMSFQEVIDKNPSKYDKVELEKRSKGKIKMNGGNDYQLNPINKKVKKKFLRNEVYAYSEGGELYLNCYKHELYSWYTKVKGENEDYFVFRASLPINMKKYGLETSSIPYAFGGIIAGFSAAKRALIRLPYVFDKKTQNVILISEKNIRKMISSSPQLVNSFEKEAEKNDVETLLQYLLKWVEE